MALYHFHADLIRRSAGQSVVSAAAYRAAEKLHSEYYGDDPDYTHKGGVCYSEIFLPPQAPSAYQDRETLWNAVEKAEEHPQAQLAYSYDIALQNELTLEENIALARKFVQELIAVELVTHTFDLTMAIFEVAQHIVQQSAGIISGTSVDFASVLGDVETQLEALEVGELLGLVVETMMLRVTSPVISLCVMLVLIGRMIEIYIYCSVGAIPLATMTNREWGQMGQNYIRGLVALGLQGFFIMICVAIYAVLIGQIGSGSSLHTAIWQCIGYTVLLCFSLFKTGSVSKSILNAR